MSPTAQKRYSLLDLLKGSGCFAYSNSNSQKVASAERELSLFNKKYNSSKAGGCVRGGRKEAARATRQDNSYYAIVRNSAHYSKRLLAYVSNTRASLIISALLTLSTAQAQTTTDVKIVEVDSSLYVDSSQTFGDKWTEAWSFIALGFTLTGTFSFTLIGAKFLARVAKTAANRF